MDTVTECVKGVLSDPMIGEPSLEYFKRVETDLRNCALAAVQRLDLELKTFEFLALWRHSMTARQATLSSLTDSDTDFFTLGT